MKRFALSLVLPLALTLVVAFGAPHAYAQVGGGYTQALKLVRSGQWQRAISIFKPLAEEGHAASQFSLGLIYHLGRGVKADVETAYDWYKKAAVQQHPPAMNNIGMMYLNGEYVVQNRDVAFGLFEMASVEHAQAKDNMGQCYENAWGVERDIVRAINFYRLAGEQGYVLGFFHAAQIFEKGYPGTPKDKDLAVRWYSMAAERNHTKSRKRLIELDSLPEHLKK